MGMFWTCEETAAALSDYLDGILPLGPFLKTRAHLFSCPGCRALLATLRALPALAARALVLEDAAQAPSRLALERAMARLARGEAVTAGPVPLEARAALEAGPDLAMRLLASTHDHLARHADPLSQLCPLPQQTLDLLPPAEQWRWLEMEGGIKRAELFADPGRGVRLLLVYAPPNALFPPHRHLGTESILILDGAMADQGRDCGRGDWIHHGEGSSHAPRIAACGCWCLIREQGTVRLLGPAA